MPDWAALQSAVIDTVFRVFTDSAVYTNAGGQRVQLAVDVDESEAVATFGGTEIAAPTIVIGILRADLDAAGISPAAGDTVTMDSGAVYQVQACRLVDQRLIWRLECADA